MLRALLIALFALIAAPAFAQITVLDDFDGPLAWEADASTDVTSRAGQVAGREGGQAMRIDYDFNGRSGYAFVARAIDLDVPENFEISFWVRGETDPNTLEIKFADASGDNVHWRQVRQWTAPDGWTQVTIKQRQIIWAWGPDPDRTFRGAARMEFVITAGEGGRGHIEVDDLVLRELPPEPDVPPLPVITASSTEGLNTVDRLVDGDRSTLWRSQETGEQSLTLDLGYEREFGGLTLRWAERLAATRYRISASSDGQDWRELALIENANGGVDWVRLPETSARWLRLDLLAPEPPPAVVGQVGAGQRLNAAAETAYGLTELEIEPLAFGETATTFVSAVAEETRRGLYPRGFHGEQPYWTLVGVDGGGESGLIGEDGAVELRRGGPSIEPFVVDNGTLVTWADVEISQGLVEDYLPIPWVEWRHEEWTLRTTALAEGEPEAARLWTRYQLINTSPRAQTLTLALAARPYQVNGPVQFLTVPGGVGPIEQIDWTGGELVLSDTIRVRPLVAPDAVAMATFDEGADPDSLLMAGRRLDPATRHVTSDRTDLPAGALIHDVTLAPGETRTFVLVTPLSGAAPALPVTGSVEAVWDQVEQRLTADWKAKLDRVDLITPPEGQRIDDTVRSSLAHMLMSRQGPILQPGTRSYNRAWIRDGAMMAEGLNRLGWVSLSADFLEWFTPFLFDDGKVPCCADDRGSDPVPENDSHGEYIFLTAETYRFDGDVERLRSVWPGVLGAIRYMDQLRASERTPENQTPERRHLYGLLPPTISHEGYSDRPAYSYWDDFWGLLGYKDAVFIAETLGETQAAVEIAAARDQFAADIFASIRATAEHHDIDWIAGAADRGDFDATSTTIALSPVGELERLPPDLLAGTFERYWDNFTARQERRQGWRDYTPYELRNVGALIRLGQRERAMRALDFFFADRRPEAWNGWAEVVGRDPREPRFIGDMPHAWISSDYIRSALDLFAYDRQGALILAAGLPLDWMTSDEGVGVAGLYTPYGRLSYHLRREGQGMVLTFDGEARPPNGYVLEWPADAPPPRATIGGRALAWDGARLVIPADVRRVDLR
ncbi:discoidin domain-containing protein [Brevundimonas sp.]|uniref:discoidin domain-containing protein n=1 Tax=Brevundimonas sp. TaxID=1871086 RepID=UPI0035AFBDED